MKGIKTLKELNPGYSDLTPEQRKIYAILEKSGVPDHRCLASVNLDNYFNKSECEKENIGKDCRCPECIENKAAEADYREDR